MEKHSEKLKRFGVSVDAALLAKFDRFAGKRGYANRCEALRDLMRKALVKEAWNTNAVTVATVTIIYDHHDPGLSDELTRIQHDFHKNVVASMHAHIDSHDCMEVIMLRGRAKGIKKLADSLISAKGVKHGELVMSAAGKALP